MAEKFRRDSDTVLAARVNGGAIPAFEYKPFKIPSEVVGTSTQFFFLYNCCFIYMVMCV